MVSFVCYNLKTTNIYIFIFNKIQNFIKKKTVHNNAIKRAKRRIRECPFLLVKIKKKMNTYNNRVGKRTIIELNLRKFGHQNQAKCYKIP